MNVDTALNLLLAKSGSTYAIVKTKDKGYVGKLIESILLLAPNSKNLDFVDGEMKKVKLVYGASGELSVKETVSISMINNEELVDFADSKYYKKMQRILLQPCLETDDSITLLKPIIFELDAPANKEIKEQIIADYNEIKAHTLAKSIHGEIGKIIQSRTKGPGGEKKTRSFYFRRKFIQGLFNFKDNNAIPIAMDNTINVQLLTPFLKYAGGKTQIMNNILATVSKITTINTYIEPFIGSGSVLFALIRSGKLSKTTQIIISDMNQALINMYIDIKNNPVALIKLVDEYITSFNKDRQNVYARLRDEFNGGDIPQINKSALFIFLNITCFNGLYRTNKKGAFNTPIGKTSDNSDAVLSTQKRNSILELSKILNTYNVMIKHCDYAESINGVAQTVQTLIYLDPPYVPVKATSFEEYLGEFDHNRFFAFCKELKCNVLVSNSYTDAVVTGLNKSPDINLRYTFKISLVTVRRMISSKSRDECFEILANNFDYIGRPLITYDHITNELADSIVKILLG